MGGYGIYNSISRLFEPVSSAEKAINKSVELSDMKTIADLFLFKNVTTQEQFDTKVTNFRANVNTQRYGWQTIFDHADNKAKRHTEIALQTN